MATTIKQIINNDEFGSEKCEKIIKLLHAMHTALDDITLQIRGSATEQEGKVLFSMHNDINLFNYLNDDGVKKSTNLDVYQLLFNSNKEGLIGLIYDEDKIKIAQIIHPETKTENLATRAQGKAYKQWMDWQAANGVQKMPNKLNQFLSQSEFTSEPNSWLSNDYGDFSLDDISIHIQVFGIVKFDQTVNKQKKSFTLTMAEKEYILVNDPEKYTETLPKKAVIGHFRDFLLLPDDDKIVEIIDDFNQNNIYSSPGDFLYEYNEEIDDNRFSSWKQIYQMYIRDNYKKYGNHSEQESRQTGVFNQQFKTTPYNKNGLICAVCWRNIKEKSGKKKNNNDPILQKWLNQEYDVDHVFNLIMNNLLELNYSGIGFLNTCGPCNRTFKGEKLWSPSWELWNALLNKTKLTIDDYPWHGAKSQGFLEKKPPGGYTKFCLKGYRNPNNKKHVKAYCEKVNNGTSFNDESIKLGEGINSKSRKKNSNPIPNNKQGGKYTDIEEIILHRLLTLINENDDLNRDNQYDKLNTNREPEKSIIKRKDLLDNIFKNENPNELKVPIVNKYLDSVKKYLAASAMTEEILGDGYKTDENWYDMFSQNNSQASSQAITSGDESDDDKFFDDLDIKETLEQSKIMSIQQLIMKITKELNLFIQNYPNNNEAIELLNTLNTQSSQLKKIFNSSDKDIMNKLLGIESIVQKISNESVKLTEPVKESNRKKARKLADKAHKSLVNNIIISRGTIHSAITGKTTNKRTRDVEYDLYAHIKTIKHELVNITGDNIDKDKLFKHWDANHGDKFKKDVSNHWTLQAIENVHLTLTELMESNRIKLENRVKEKKNKTLPNTLKAFVEHIKALWIQEKLMQVKFIKEKEKREQSNLKFDELLNTTHKKVKTNSGSSGSSSNKTNICNDCNKPIKQNNESYSDKYCRYHYDNELTEYTKNVCFGTDSYNKKEAVVGGKTKKNRRRKKRTRNKRKRKKTKKKRRRKKRTRNKRN